MMKENPRVDFGSCVSDKSKEEAGHPDYRVGWFPDSQDIARMNVMTEDLQHQGQSPRPGYVCCM